MLTQQQAARLLTEAAERNPGPWEAHSRVTADNARRIAQRIPGMDPRRAWLSGLLHDLGRGHGVTGVRHTLDGYRDLMALGEPQLARICLTHSFPDPEHPTFLGAWDITGEETRFLKDYLLQRDYDDYDALIQFCDLISLPTGACVMEKRLVDISLRYGTPEGTVAQWRRWLGLKNIFDRRCGCDVYTLLPGVLEQSCRSLI